MRKFAALTLAAIFASSAIGQVQEELFSGLGIQLLQQQIAPREVPLGERLISSGAEMGEPNALADALVFQAPPGHYEIEVATDIGDCSAGEAPYRLEPRLEYSFPEGGLFIIGSQRWPDCIVMTITKDGYYIKSERFYMTPQ